jgi:hypothetical protein
MATTTPLLRTMAMVRASIVRKMAVARVSRASLAAESVSMPLVNGVGGV